MYKISEIDRLKRIVEYYGLEVPSGFYALSLRKLQKICNGCGPEVWSEDKRKALTGAFAEYECCILVHDVCQALHMPQRLADKLLWINLLKIWEDTFGVFRWFNPAAWRERFKVLPCLFEILTENRDA